MESKQPLFFIVAGEPSGDLHGSRLIGAIKKNYPNARFVGHGGDQMVRSGLELMYHTNDLAIMGFAEIIKHLPFMLNVMGESLGKLREIKPDRIILIDYPGFNLKLSKNCNGLGIPITYFILPQLWAWKENRIKFFRKYIDQSLSIFPFEEDWFNARGVTVNYVGHPFSEDLSPKISKLDFFNKHNLEDDDKILALLPGSRQQEIDKHLLIYYKSALKLKEKYSNLRIILGKSPNIKIPKLEHIIIESNDIYSVMKYSTAAITTSGTATLECAFLDTPEIACYKLSNFSGAIIKYLNKSPFLSIVNLIGGKKIIPEFVQKEVTVSNIVKNVYPLLSNTKERKNILAGYENVRKALGFPGAYDRAAKEIIKKLSNG